MLLLLASLGIMLIVLTISNAHIIYSQLDADVETEAGGGGGDPYPKPELDWLSGMVKTTLKNSPLPFETIAVGTIAVIIIAAIVKRLSRTPKKQNQRTFDESIEISTDRGIE
jgi:hypothetical protein